MRAWVVIGILATVLVVAYLSHRQRPEQASYGWQTTNSISQLEINRSDPPRKSAPSRDTRIDRQDPEFVQRVLPVVHEFFGTLKRAGASPLSDELSFNNIRIHHTPHGMDCRFLIGDSWTGTVVATKDYTGLIHFGQRGPDNPFRAISHANTNALSRLSKDAIKMPQDQAERIMNRIADAFNVDRSKFEKPEIYPEKMFDYDLGLYTIQYRKKGSDPINQLNYTLNFSIKATSPTTAVLVMYSETPLKR